MAMINFKTLRPFGPPPLKKEASNSGPPFQGGIKGGFVLFLFIFLFCFAEPKNTFAATFSLNPSSASVGNGCQSSIDIRLNASGQSTNAADIIIDYNPSLVDIIDSDIGNTGVQITPGTVYTNYFGNVVDTNAGVIRLTGASFNTFFTSLGVFGSIQFRPKTSSGAATFNIRFTGANPYNSLDSNIADSVSSNDLLSSVVNGSYTLSSTSCVADNISPNITHVSPTNGQTGISSSANIVTTITDESSGVDQGSVEIIINGVTYRSGQSGVVVTGTSSSYTFTVTPIALLFTNQLNTVVVNASDFASNSKSSTITFNAPSTPTSTPIPSPTQVPTRPPVLATPTPIIVPPGVICPPHPTCAASALPTSIIPTSYVPTSIIPTSTVCKPISPTPTPVLNSIDDHKSPFIEFVKPKPKDTIDLSPTLVFKVSDYDSGIDLNSLKVVFNDQIYNLNSVDLKYKGDSHSYEITLKTNQKLKDSTEYQLEVSIADLNQNGFSQTINLKTSTPFLNQVSNIINKNPIIGQKEANVTVSQIVRGSLLLLLFSLVPFILFFIYRLFKSLQVDNNIPYGLVFNSKTNEPIYKAKIEVYNIDNRKITTCFTNIFGIFAGNLAPGKYRFLVEAKSFAFPSESDFKSLDFPHLYHGEIVAPTYLNIPLDQKSPIAENKLLPKYGITTPNITLGLKETKFDALITTRVSDELGRYRFIVPHGRYQLVHKNKNIGSVIDTRHRIDGYTVINADFKP